MFDKKISDDEVVSRAIEFIGRNKNRALCISKIWLTKNDGKRLTAENFFSEWNEIGQITGKIEPLEIRRSTENYAYVDTAKLRLIYNGETVSIVYVRLRHEKPVSISLFDTKQKTTTKRVAA